MAEQVYRRRERDKYMNGLCVCVCISIKHCVRAYEVPAVVVKFANN